LSLHVLLQPNIGFGIDFCHESMLGEKGSESLATARPIFFQNSFFFELLCYTEIATKVVGLIDCRD